MSIEDLKDLIRDILAQEMGEEDGEEADMEVDLEAPVDGMEVDADMEADEEEVDLEELLSELTEGEDTMEETVEETVEEVINDPDTESAHGNVAEEDVMEEGFTDLAIQLRDSGLVDPENAMTAAKAIVAGGSAAVTALGALIASMRDSKASKEAPAAELDEALSTIEALQEDLNETNLLNAKLLYLNKIFKAKSLTESQKANTIAAFDKAETVKEVKLVFETMNENISTTKKNVNEVKGMASKAAGMAPKKPEILSESNQMVARMQKLAGIIK